MKSNRIPIILAGATLSFWQLSAATNDLPASIKLPLGTSTTRGFVVRTVQAPEAVTVGNSLQRALKQLNGTLADSTGALISNEATPGAGAAGAYTVDTLNFDADGNTYDILQAPGTPDEAVLFTLNPVLFPGIPGTGGHTLNFATEAVAYLELPAGVTTFGVSVGADRTDVNDDDSYVAFAGQNPRDFFAAQVGSYERGGVQAFKSNQHSENTWSVNAPSAGIYPFRIVQWQTGHGSALAFYTVTPTTDPNFSERVLVNDPNDARAIKA